MAAMLTTSGVAHLVAPGPFERIVPAALGPPRPWVVLSGLSELACAGALAVPATRRAGGWASAALLVAVYPANVTMARQAQRAARRPDGAETGTTGTTGTTGAAGAHGVPRSTGRRRLFRAVALARLPVQVPLVWWAVSVARTPSTSRARSTPGTSPAAPTARALA